MRALLSLLSSFLSPYRLYGVPLAMYIHLGHSPFFYAAAKGFHVVESEKKRETHKLCEGESRFQNKIFLKII